MNWKLKDVTPTSGAMGWKLKDVTVTPAGFGTPLFTSSEMPSTKIEVYGDIKKPRWWQFWKRKQYERDMQAEFDRMCKDFSPIKPEGEE